MIQYEMIFRFDLGQAVAPVGELVRELNTHLAEMGCSERTAITSQLPVMTLTSSRELKPEEQETVKRISEEQFQAAFPKWNVTLDCFRRKPGNVQQSAS